MSYADAQGKQQFDGMVSFVPNAHAIQGLGQAGWHYPPRIVYDGL